MHSVQIPELNSRGLRQFGIVTGGIVAVIFGLLLPWLLEISIPLWPWVITAVLVIWALLRPTSLRPVYRLWMRFGYIMSRIMTPIVLGVLFYLIISPMGMIRKVFGEDSLSRNLDPTVGTYRIRSKKPSVDNLKRPF